MTTLRDRSFRCVVETVEFTDLWCRFAIKRTTASTANKGEIKIANMNESNRHRFEQQPDAAIQLDAGYADGRGTIFLGRASSVTSEHSGTDWVTTFKCGDGEKEMRSKRISKPVTKGTSVEVTVNDIAAAMGIREGNIAEVMASIGNPSFSRSSVLHGNAAREMTTICRSQGLSWSVQNGVLQLLRIGQPTSGAAILCNRDHGMVGSASIDAKGVMSVVMLIQPEIEPGRIIVVESEQVKGQFRIENVDYDGDTHSKNWYAKVQGKAY